MAEVKWTAEGERWLRDVHDYIATDDPTAAQRVVEEIHEKVRVLREFPRVGHRFRTTRDGEIRILIYGHYRVAYLLKPDETIDILGVLHGALDIDKYLP